MTSDTPGGRHRRIPRPHSLAEVLEREILRARYEGRTLDPNRKLYLRENGLIAKVDEASQIALGYLTVAQRDNERDPSGEETRARRVKVFREWANEWEQQTRNRVE